MRGKGKTQAVTGRGGRRREGIGSDRERWEAEGRHRQRQGEVGGGGKAQAATGRGGRQREGIGSDRERWEAKGRHPLTRCHGTGHMVHGRWLDPRFTLCNLTTRCSAKRTREGIGSERWEAKGRHSIE